MDKGFTVPQIEKIQAMAKEAAIGVCANMFEAHNLESDHPWLSKQHSIAIEKEKPDEWDGGPSERAIIPDEPPVVSETARPAAQE